MEELNNDDPLGRPPLDERAASSLLRAARRADERHFANAGTADSWRTIFVPAPAGTDYVDVPASILKDPQAEPERFKEIVAPMWDSTADLAERDYRGLLTLIERMRGRHKKHRQPLRSNAVHRHRLEVGLSVLERHASHYGTGATVFGSLGLHPFNDWGDFVHAGWHFDPDYGTRYKWAARLRTMPDADRNEATIQAQHINYALLIATEEAILQGNHMGKPRRFFPLTIDPLGSRTWSEAIQGAHLWFRYDGGHDPEEDQVYLRLTVAEAVLRSYELYGHVERFDSANVQPKPKQEDQEEHIARLIHESSYVVEYGHQLMQQRGISRKAALEAMKREIERADPGKTLAITDYGHFCDRYREAYGSGAD